MQIYRLAKTPAKLLGLVCSLGLVLAAVSQIAPKTEQTLRKPIMPALESNLELRRSEIVVGESFPLSIIIKNASSAPIEVPNRLGPEELEFLVRRAGESGVLTMLNAREAMARRSVDRLEIVTPQRDVLAPGADVSYHEDPSAYLLEPLAPGNYTLSVAFGAGAARFESKGSPLRVLPSTFEAVSVVVQPASQRIGWCIAYADPRKNWAVFASVSPMGGARVGVLDRVADMHAPEAVDGVAAAIETEETIGETWVSWLYGETLVAGIHDGGALAARSETAPLGLRQTSLHRVGWRLTPDAATFAVMGLDAENHPALALVSFSRTDAPVIRRFAVDSPAVPAIWRLGHRNGAGGPQWMLVFAEGAGASARVRCQRIPAPAERAQPAVTLSEHAGPLVSLGYSPTDASSNVVDLLVGPFPEERKMKLVRVSADTAAAPVAEWDIPLPTVADGAPPPGWTVSDCLMADPILLAKAGARLLARRASGGEWKTLADQPASAVHGQVILLSDQPWVTWSDQSSGLHLEFFR